MTTKLKYTHLPLGEDVVAFAGYYTPEEEVRMNYCGREVLYVTGHVVVETTCSAPGGMGCGTMDHWYAIVPGYLLKWQHGKNEHGLPVSEVEQISDEETRNRIKQIILDKESVSQVEFR